MTDSTDIASLCRRVRELGEPCARCGVEKRDHDQGGGCPGWTSRLQREAPRERKCPKCYGDGSLFWYPRSGGIKQIKCPICNGTGRAPEQDGEETDDGR